MSRNAALEAASLLAALEPDAVARGVGRYRVQRARARSSRARKAAQVRGAHGGASSGIQTSDCGAVVKRSALLAPRCVIERALSAS